MSTAKPCEAASRIICRRQAAHAVLHADGRHASRAGSAGYPVSVPERLRRYRNLQLFGRPLPDPAEPAGGGPTRVDQHRARHRHDLRHPDRRHRSVRRIDPGGLRHGGPARGDLVQLQRNHHSDRAAGRCRLRPDQWQSDLGAEAAALHRDARIADRGARPRPACSATIRRSSTPSCRSRASPTTSLYPALAPSRGSP